MLLMRLKLILILLLVAILPLGAVPPWVTMNSVSKPLIPTMTSNTTPSGNTASASTTGGSTSAYQAMTGGGTSWESANSENDEWVQIQFASPKVATGWTFNSFQTEGTEIYNLQGSNDGSSWTTIDTENAGGPQTTYTFKFAHATAAYLYYRMDCPWPSSFATPWTRWITIFQVNGFSI